MNENNNCIVKSGEIISEQHLDSIVYSEEWNYQDQ